MVGSKLVVVGLVVAAAMACPAWSQTIGQPSPVDPQVVLYQFFFFRASWLQDQAAKLAASGQDGTGLSSFIQREARLTPQEAASLTAITTDWSEKDSAILGSIRALAAAAPGTSTPQLRQLAAQRLQNVVIHVNLLQSALGSTRFPVLDYYVHSTVKLNSGP